MSNHEGRRRSASGKNRALGHDALEGDELATPRVFSISEVNALIPALNVIVAQQLRDQSDIERGMAELTRRLGETPSTLEPEPGENAEVARLKASLRPRIQCYEARWRKVRELGGVVRGPQIGLVEFMGRVCGRLVWLSWRYGEDALRYYRELNDGVTGRTPLRESLRKSLLN